MAERTNLRRLPLLMTPTCSCGCECCVVPEEPEREARAERFPVPIYQAMSGTCGCACCARSEEIPARA